MRPRLLFATRNPWKVRLFTPTFQAAGLDFCTLLDRPELGEPPAETGATLAENARLKARHYHALGQPWVFGDDAGLEIEALGGEPGVQARRWAGHFADDVDDETWLAYLLERMRTVPQGRRGACSVSAWALVMPDGTEHVRMIRWPAFEIATRPLRPLQPGSPLSAVRVGELERIESVQAAIQREWSDWGLFMN